jgi:chemotaxis protein MotB
MSTTPAPIVIIKKKVHGHGGHHGGAWKVAYADFVTAMMAFFLVMWIVGQSAQTKDGIAQYFRDPGVFETSRGNGLLPGTGDTPKEVPPSGGNGPMTGAAEQIRRALEAMPSFKNVSDRIQISVTPEGLLIDIGDRDGDSFFASGSADLQPVLVDILLVIGQELATFGNPVVVDGHTDNRHYRAQGGYDNWTLSADRANQARRILTHAGMKPAQFDAVRAYADTRPVPGSKAEDPRNRRIAILVKSGPAAPEDAAPDGAAVATPVQSRAATTGP